MRYNLKNADELREAFWYLDKLGNKEAEVEIKKVVALRSLKQNSYLHLIITAFSDHFGYEVTEGKQVYKYINKEIFYYKKNNVGFWRSSADLNKDEMSQSIDRFRRYSAHQGFDLPLAIDQDWLRRIQNDHEKLMNERI